MAYDKLAGIPLQYFLEEHLFLWNTRFRQANTESMPQNRNKESGERILCMISSFLVCYSPSKFDFFVLKRVESTTSFIIVISFGYTLCGKKIS